MSKYVCFEQRSDGLQRKTIISFLLTFVWKVLIFNQFQIVEKARAPSKRVFRLWLSFTARFVNVFNCQNVGEVL